MIILITLLNIGVHAEARRRGDRTRIREGNSDHYARGAVGHNGRLFDGCVSHINSPTKPELNTTVQRHDHFCARGAVPYVISLMKMLFL